MEQKITCTELSKQQRILGLIIIIICYCMAVFLNSFNISILISLKNMKQRHYRYLCYFSLAMISYTFSSTFDVVDFYKEEYIFGTVGCKISQYLKEFTLIFTTFILLWISFDQYIYVFYSFKYAKILPRVNVNIICTIILALILSIPYPIIYHTRQKECNTRTCTGDKYEKNKTQTITDNIEKNCNQQTSHQSKERKKLMKTISPMIILLGFFLITWTPFILVRWLRIFNEDINPYILRTSHLLFMIYQVFYPIIFTLIDKKLRRKFTDKIPCFKRS
ncbi:hypothetical protein HZS_6885 [Henneguya salminicola]|nr:hypothetical protein HZS_6885 [Henneguya salminicola]